MIEKRRLNVEDMNEFIKIRVEMLMSDESIDYDEEQIIMQTTKYFKKNLNEYLHIFGIFNNGNLISVAAIEIIKRLPTPKIYNINSEIGYVCSVYTKPEYRKNGYATDLLNDILEYASKRGITRFKLSTHNPEAVRIYEKLGFEKDENMMKK